MATRPGPNKTPTLRAAPNLNAVLGGGWTPLPKKIRQSTLKQSTKIVYNSLCSFFQMSEYTQAEGSWQRECAWPTHEEIAQDIGEAHRNTVSHAINELLQYNVIMRQRRGLGQPDLYWLVDPEDWCLPIDNGDEESPPRRTKTVHLDAQESGSQKHKKPADGGTVIVTPEAQETSRREHNNCDSLYKKQQKRNIEPTNNKHQQKTTPSTRAADAAAGEGSPTPSLQEEKKPAKRGRPKKNAQLELFPGSERPARVSMAHAEGETDEEWAAREFLSRVRGYGECGVPLFVRWTMDLGPLVALAGRNNFARWVTWLASDPWLKENGYKLRIAKWQEEFENWWNKPEPRPVRRGSAPAPARDERKIDNRIRDAEVLSGCLACGAEVGTPHYEGCELLPLGKTVTSENENRPLMLAKLQEMRRQNAS